MADIKEIYKEEGILFATLQGTFSLLSAKANFILILEEASKYELTRILIDTTNVISITKSLFEATDYGKFVAESTISIEQRRLISKAKIAYLYSPSAEEVLKAGEVTAESIGLQAKAFNELGEAIKWLKNGERE